MTFKELPAGQYEAKIIDWGLYEVAALGGKIKAVIQFSIKHEDEWVSGRWEGFFENKDGEPNKNTIKTLIACGFRGDDYSDLIGADGLDTSKELSITIEKDGEYNRIRWVNDKNAPQPMKEKKASPKTKIPLKVKAALREMRDSVIKQADDGVPF